MAHEEASRPPIQQYEWRVHETRKSFEELIGAFVYEYPLHNQLIISMMTRDEEAVARFYPNGVRARSVHRSCDNVVVGALFHAPPLAVVLSKMPSPEVASFAGASYAAEHLNDATSVTGATEADAFMFIGAFTAVTRVYRTPILEPQGLWELRSVNTSALTRSRVAGHVRIADREEDREFLVAQGRAFFEEALPQEQPPSLAILERAWREHDAVVFETADGEKCAYACFSRRIAVPGGGVFVSIGPVYTLPAHRGQGLATQLVAEMCSRAIRGEFVKLDVFGQRVVGLTLFTRLSDPAANRAYERAGFVMIGRMLRAWF